MQNTAQFPQTIPDITTEYLNPDSVAYTAAKTALIILGIMYLVYAIVTVRQVKIMNATIDTPLGPVIQMLAWVNLAVAVLFFLGVIFLL